MAIHPTRDLRSETFVKDRETRGKIEEKAANTECSTFPCHQSENSLAQYFDVDTKLWKPLASVAQLGEITDLCYSAELIGNYLYVVTEVQQQQECHEYVVYRYHILNNTWEKLPKLNIREHKDELHSPPKICLCSVISFFPSFNQSLVQHNDFDITCVRQRGHFHSKFFFISGSRGHPSYSRFKKRNNGKR